MATQVQDIAAQLGGKRALRRSFRTDQDINEAIREGFPQEVVAEVMHSADITLKELAESLDLSPRSLQRRRREGKLAKFESDRIYRLARVIAIAKRYIGDDEKARRWLKRRNRALGGRAPLDLIDTEPGARDPNRPEKTNRSRPGRVGVRAGTSSARLRLVSRKARRTFASIYRPNS